jgi:glycosyltransferase involved in cell wall biosynthesis
VREFVASARQLRREGINARFAIVGDTAGNRDALGESEMDEIRAEGVVELWGWSNDIPGVMGRASIICLPSYHEGLPKALIDACAAGRGIVASDIPGCRAVVTEGMNGLLVPPQNAGALADALRKLLLDETLRKNMGRHGRRIAEERFDIALVIESTIELYSLLEARRAAAAGNRAN